MTARSEMLRALLRDRRRSDPKCAVCAGRVDCVSGRSFQRRPPRAGRAFGIRAACGWPLRPFSRRFGSSLALSLLLQSGMALLLFGIFALFGPRRLFSRNVRCLYASACSLLRCTAVFDPCKAYARLKVKKRHSDVSVSFFWMRQQPNLPWGDPKVLSALESLTSVFGMRTGGSSPLSSPQWLYIRLRGVYTSYDFSPYPKEKSSRLARDFPPARKTDNCIAHVPLFLRLLSFFVLVEISFSYFGFVFRSLNFVEIKPSTY